MAAAPSGTRTQRLHTNTLTYQTGIRFPLRVYHALKRMSEIRRVSLAYLVVEYCEAGLARDSERIDELVEDM